MIPVDLSMGRRRPDPLTISFFASLTLFLPLIIIGNFDLLLDSEFQHGSLDSTITVACSLALVLPLLIDIVLDIFSYGNVAYAGFRFLSIFGVVASAAIALAYQDTICAGAAIQTAYQWGYFLEFTIISSLLYHLLPDYFTYARVIFVNTVIYIWDLIFLLNSISKYNSDTLFTTYFVLFWFMLFIYMGIGLQWFYALWLGYRSSELTLKEWYQTLQSKEQSALALLIAAMSAGMLLIIVFYVIDPAFANANSITSTVWIILIIARSVVCVVTYMIPSRLFRQDLLFAKKDLEVKTEFIK